MESLNVDGTAAYWNAAAHPRLSSYDHTLSQRDAESLMNSRRDIDRELAVIYDVLCTFKTRRNALASISRLPAEILSRIFSLHAINQPPGSDEYVWDDKDEDANPPSMSQVQLGWITITHVCRHWRQIALEQSCLWTSICFALGSRWVEEMLARSKAAPIVFEREIPPAPSPRNTHSNTDTQSPPDEAGILAGHMSHIQELKLRASSPTMQRLVESLTGPAPLLERLSLTSLVGDAVTLPFTLFAAHTPHLRRVLLDGFHFLWTSSLFRGLEHLHVITPAGWSSAASSVHPQLGPDAATSEATNTAYTIPQLLDVLRNMPTLQSLVLKNCLPNRDVSPADTPTAKLADLTLLGLEGSVNDCIRLLHHLVLPPTAALDLRCGTRLPTDVEFRPILEWVASHLRLRADSESASTGGIQTLALSSTSIPPTLRITGWNACLVAENRASYKLDATPAIELTFAWPIAVPIPGELDVVQRIVQALPLHDLRALAMTMVHRTWTMEEGAEIARGCPTVQHLLGKGGVGIALSHALAPTTLPFPFPKLVSFTLVGADLMAMYEGDRPHDADVLTDVLMKRRAAGVGLKVLKIEECVVSPAQIGGLKAAAQTVLWDDRGRAMYSRVDAGLWPFAF